VFLPAAKTTGGRRSRRLTRKSRAATLTSGCRRTENALGEATQVGKDRFRKGLASKGSNHRFAKAHRDTRALTEEAVIVNVQAVAGAAVMVMSFEVIVEFALRIRACVTLVYPTVMGELVRMTMGMNLHPRNSRRKNRCGNPHRKHATKSDGKAHCLSRGVTEGT